MAQTEPARDKRLFIHNLVKRDPLANLNFLEPDYTWVTQKLMEVADHRAKGRVVSLLEGGYDLTGLAKSVDAHVTALMRG